MITWLGAGGVFGGIPGASTRPWAVEWREDSAGGAGCRIIMAAVGVEGQPAVYGEEGPGRNIGQGLLRRPQDLHVSNRAENLWEEGLFRRQAAGEIGTDGS